MLLNKLKGEFSKKLEEIEVKGNRPVEEIIEDFVDLLITARDDFPVFDETPVFPQKVLNDIMNWFLKYFGE